MHLGPGFIVGWGNGLILGYLMYRSGLVPRPMAMLGLIAGPVLVFADWLEDRGDTRGELLRLNLEIGRDLTTPRPELEPRRFDLAPKQPHFAPRAKAMISLFMQGGPSHLDLFDPKPMLARYDGQPYPGTIRYDNAAQASAIPAPSDGAASGRVTRRKTVQWLAPRVAAASS